MTNKELLFICDAIRQVALNYQEWQKEYQYNSGSNEFESIAIEENIEENVKEWFHF